MKDTKKGNTPIISLRMPPELIKRLRKMAREKNTDVSSLVRAAVINNIQQQK